MKDQSTFSKNILKSAIREVLFEVKTPGSAQPAPASGGGTPATQQTPVYVQDLEAHLDAVRQAATTIKQADTDIGEIAAQDIGPDPTDNIIALESNLETLIGIDAQRPGHPPFALLLLAKSYSDNDYSWINESRKRKKNLLNEGIPAAAADSLTTRFASTALKGLRSALGDRGFKVVTDAEFENLLRKTGLPLDFVSGAFEATATKSNPAVLLKKAAEVAAREAPVTDELGKTYIASIRRVLSPDPQYADFNQKYIEEIETIISNAIENKRSLSFLDDEIRALESTMGGGYLGSIKTPLQELIELTATKVDDVLSTGAAAGLSRGYARMAAVGGIRTAQIALSPAVVTWKAVAAWGNSFAKKPGPTLGWTALGGTATATALLAYRYFDEPENPLKKFGTEADAIRAKIVGRTTPFNAQDFSNLKADVSIISDALLAVELVASTEAKFPPDRYANIQKARLMYENIERALGAQGPLMYSGVEA